MTTERLLKPTSLPFIELCSSYFALLKPRVVTLVLFTAFCAMVIACCSVKTPVNISSLCVALLCIACGSGGAGAINMWYDMDIDSVMLRTQSRPLPSGKIKPIECLVFGVALCIISVFMTFALVNTISAVLLAFAIVYYSVFYTMLLKRFTPQNIVIGGAAGAFPPMIGWSAVTSNFSLEGVILFLIIFLWTPPHFWSLALKSCRDYKLVNVPMLPVVSGCAVTKLHILCYSLVLFISSLFPYFIGMSNTLYLVFASILGALFIYHAILVYYDESKCMKMFYFSVAYLFMLFAAMMADSIIFSCFFSF